MSVSLRQLEYFVAVVDEGSFTTAAARLHVSQPGLSHQIQALERQLGGPLLERLPRGVRLTPAGRTALPHARASLAHAERASNAARRASGVDAGELHVGTLYSISVGVLPAALGTWRRRYPDVQVRLVEFRHTNELIAAMEAGQADLAVGPVPPAWDGPVREIGTEEFVVAAAPGTLLPGNVVPPAFDGVLRRPDPPVRRMLSVYTRARPDPVTAAFVEAICHHTLATPAHILNLIQPAASLQHGLD